MKIYRYMSIDEFNRLVSGETLVNRVDYAKRGNRSSSIGFCFLGESVWAMPCGEEEAEERHYTPEAAFEFLRGIVRADVLVEMEAPEAALTKSAGLYADPEGFWTDRVIVEEFCATEYGISLGFMPTRIRAVYSDFSHPFGEWEDAKCTAIPPKDWRDFADSAESSIGSRAVIGGPVVTAINAEIAKI